MNAQRIHPPAGLRPTAEIGKSHETAGGFEAIVLLFAGGIFGTIKNAERHILAVGERARSDEIARQA
ncbi:hypothetical protein [Rhizobium sp. 1399]|jgi:hypothetical protein|uniref:hypothetical protein n=1 Tax=Rhizobium sp. 1399 TaxID=2817758 RepID=UPI0028620A8C|nr:hypothetical protein [Rhizobium sp. 1399]MDR6668963.1 hypothetical protein [Rhizobium sp. 1399]